MNKIFGLPAHPLLVHLPVVLVPLALVGAVLMAVSSRLRHRLRWVVAPIAVLGGLGAILAAGAGESLEEGLPDSGAIERHAEMGETARLLSVIFAIVVVLFVVGEWWLKRRSERRAGEGVNPEQTRSRWARWAAPVAAVVCVACGAAATWTIVDAGHSGARATWGEKVGSERGYDGDRGDLNGGYGDDDDD